MRGCFRFALFLILLIGAGLIAAGPAAGQAPKVQPKKAPSPMPSKGKEKEPKDESLETKDGVKLKATFYPGAEEKDSVPIIMIHDWEGKRGEYHNLALHLQSKGHSIIVPDLRGHGDSKTQKQPDGSTRTISSDSLKLPRDADALLLDLEACKKLLLEKHNAGKLNIEELTVIGAEFGAIMAVRWAAFDWSQPRLPAFKQGQDVKALVLLTPTPSFKGLTMREALANPAVRSQISMMIVAGAEDAKGTREAKQLHKSLEAFHYKPLPSDDAEEVAKNEDLFLVQPKTNLAGTKLLSPALPVNVAIGRFIDRRLVAKKTDFPWEKRESPLGN